MRGAAALYSSARTRDGAGRDDWRTPAPVLAVVREALGAIDLDPCADADPCHWFAVRNYPATVDGLSGPWCSQGLFVNPPYSQARTWCGKLAAEYAAGHVTAAVLLIPARPDTCAWRLATADAAAVCFIKGRLRFVGATNSAPFPSALVYLGPDVEGFTGATAGLGRIWAPVASCHTPVRQPATKGQEDAEPYR